MATPIVPWIGGKRRLAENIFARFPAHSCYVEAFCGAAAIFFAKEPSEVEVLNDINGELVNLYRVVQHHLEEFVRQFKWALTSRQIFEWEKQKVPATLTDIQRAARFYYLQKLSFGGRVEGQSFGTATTSGPRFNLLRIEEDLSQAHLRLHSALIENQPWDRIVERYDRPHTFFYLDPPYWETEGYGVDFSWAQYQRIAELAKSCQGSMLISLNDHVDIRRCFEGLHIESLGITYTVGGGAGTAASEVLIWNQHCEDNRRVAGTLPLSRTRSAHFLGSFVHPAYARVGVWLRNPSYASQCRVHRHNGSRRSQSSCRAGASIHPMRSPLSWRRLRTSRRSSRASRKI